MTHVVKTLVPSVWVPQCNLSHVLVSVTAAAHVCPQKHFIVTIYLFNFSSYSFFSISDVFCVLLPHYFSLLVFSYIAVCILHHIKDKPGSTRAVYFAFITCLMSYPATVYHIQSWILGVDFLHVLCVLQVSGRGKVSEEMIATVEFTNPFSFNLENVYIRMEGPGMMEPKSRYYR